MSGFQFIYFTNHSVNKSESYIQPVLLCFNVKKCPILTNIIMNITMINNLTCTDISIIKEHSSIYNLDNLIYHLKKIAVQCLTKGIDLSCNSSNEFHCNKSLKCISYHRVQDGHQDCYFNEDEEFLSCSLNDSRRFQCFKEYEKCLSPVAIGNGFRDCSDRKDEEIYYEGDFNKTTPYSHFCLGNAAQRLYSYNYKDSYQCQFWPCYNPYVLCDQIWDCPNGIDELNCSYTNCLINQHECRNNQLNLTICLSMSQMAVHRNEYCYGFSSESIYFIYNETNINETIFYLWKNAKCLHEKNVCLSDRRISTIDKDHVCLCDKRERYQSLDFGLPVRLPLIENALCYLKMDIYQDRKEPFASPLRLGYYPLVNSLSISQKSNSRRNKQKTSQTYLNISQTWFCNRGILIFTGQNYTKTCLCPPSYFGSQCQWQSQRISLTLQFILSRVTLVSASFQVILMLINEQDEILDQHEEILFTPLRDCRTKFNLYLLYPQRPKSFLNKYSIRIDLFNKLTLTHWTSWYLSIPFQFLPVNRISRRLIIPKEQIIKECRLSCGEHGQCLHYTNNQSKPYCLCEKGYSGRFCNETYECLCSNDSYCHSPNICICPLNRFGSKCYLKRSICSKDNNPCEKRGLCIPTDDRIDLQGYFCHCNEQYFGKHCESSSPHITLQLDKTIIKSSSFVFLHIITMFRHSKHEQTTIMKKIPIDSDTIKFYISKEFHLVYLQLLNQSYYLGIIREKFISSENISGQITSKQYCPYVKSYINSSMYEYGTIEYPKYYPFVCREYLHLMCFYDETLICTCDVDRFANCVEFNHTLDQTCQGENNCENDGRCFQNNQTCPTQSICACQHCFYGGKCQMSTKGNLLSLDPIIGYYIKPNIPFSNQPPIIQMTFTITLLILIIGLIDVILSILTFHMKNPREVGCGYYLFSSSIIAFFMIIMLGIKFLSLLLSQMHSNQNESLIACKLIDILLKSFLASNEWIIACVAIERAINTMSGTRFNKIKSKQIAKWIIPFLICLILISYFHESYYRTLLYDTDEDEQRIWCFVRYPSMVDNYNYFLTFIHFLGPLIINILSAFSIIILVARNRSNIQQDKSYNQHFKEQLKRHKHVLVSPLILVLLGSPRLIFSFLNGCMKTPRNPWFYIIGYYISFIPPILTFPIFVLPSDSYRKIFQSAIQQQIVRFRSRFLSYNI
ncbi:unnamed protein product [Adineta ricciae]|nr:unnamed protein product [Adineta ricciae]